MYVMLFGSVVYFGCLDGGFFFCCGLFWLFGCRFFCWILFDWCSYFSLVLKVAKESGACHSNDTSGTLYTAESQGESWSFCFDKDIPLFIWSDNFGIVKFHGFEFGVKDKSVFFVPDYCQCTNGTVPQKRETGIEKGFFSVIRG